jgi:hypothetical protein
MPAVYHNRESAAMTPDIRPIPETPLRYHRGRLQQSCVVTRYDPERPGRQVSQGVEWVDVPEVK